MHHLTVNFSFKWYLLSLIYSFVFLIMSDTASVFKLLFSSRAAFQLVYSKLGINV